MGSLAQISSRAIQCSFNTRFWKVLVQIHREVPEGSVADTSWGSGAFRSNYLLRLRRVLWVPEGSGADALWGSGGFRCRYPLTFGKCPVQVLGEVPERYGADTWLGSRVLVQVPGEIWWGSRQVPEVFRATTWWGSGGSRWRCLVRFRRVPGQIPCEVPEGPGADALWGSGGFRCRYPLTFWKFPVQVLGEVPERYGADTWLGSRVLVQVPGEIWWGSGQVPEVFRAATWWGSGADTLWGSGQFRCR